MKRRSTPWARHIILGVMAAIGTVVALPSVASAHPEHYGQSAYVEIQSGRVNIELDMSPGTKVASDVVKIIDTNNDGAIDDEEGRGYANVVLSDLSVVVDGEALTLTLESASFPLAKNLATGEDMLRLMFVATYPTLAGGAHQLVFDNHHRPTQTAPQAHAFTATKQLIGITKLERDPKNERLTVTFTVEPTQQTKPTNRLDIVAVSLLFVAGAVLTSSRRLRKARSI